MVLIIFIDMLLVSIGFKRLRESCPPKVKFQFENDKTPIKKEPFGSYSSLVSLKAECRSKISSLFSLQILPQNHCDILVILRVISNESQLNVKAPRA
jgi:hypothetical protein